MAHYDIFRHQLLITAPAYGYALWDPDPGNLYPAVEVGDVGYIREGKFHRLFNVLLPAEHPSHENGVPEYHEQLDIKKNHINKGTLSPHNFCSTSVTSRSPESDLQANGPKQEGEVSFLCRMNQGAVLCLPIKAKKEDTVAIKRFGKCMIKHIDTWFAWAQQLELGVDRMEDIILVTGTHRTRSYTNVAFPGGREDAQASFRANLKVDHHDGITINWQLSHEHIRGAHLNPGPDGKDLPEDQCIFIRGFRVIRKYKIFSRLKGAAGPNPDPEGYDEEPDVELVPVPAVPEYRDPLHMLLEFIAEEALNCDLVLVHDNDLAELHGTYDGTASPIEYPQPDAMFSHLRRAELKIHEIPFGPDLLSADNGGNADTETVWVATLSNIFEELPPSSTPPSSRRSLLHVPIKEGRTLFQSSEGMDNPATSMSQAHPTTSNIQELIEIALKEYEERTGINLLEYHLAIELKNCDSADSVIEILQARSQESQRLREHGGDLMVWPVVYLVHALSTNGALEEDLSLPLPPTIAIFAGIGVLLDATKRTGASNDALVNFFESIENLLWPLDVYTKTRPTTGMTIVPMGVIFIELLSILALGAQQVEQGLLLAQYDTVGLGSDLFGTNGVDIVLQRLDRLNQEESRATAVQTLEVVHGLLKNMKVVMNGGESSISELRGALVSMQQVTSNMNKAKRDQSQTSSQRWLSPPDPSTNHNILCEIHHSGTTAWDIQRDTFREWTTTGSLLWIHGKLGSGKSVLCSTIIEDIEDMWCETGLASLAYFYFDVRDTTKQDIRGLLTSLLFQLSARSNLCCEILSTLYHGHESGSRQPSNDVLTQCLKDMLTIPRQGPVYIIVDAIDECPNISGTPSPRGSVLGLLDELVQLKRPGLHICVTSRLESDIETVLRPLSSHSIFLDDNTGNDIFNYISAVVNTDRKMRTWTAEDQRLVIDTLSEKADGMFRWVSCQLDALRRSLPINIRRVLGRLPKPLIATYENALERIDEENWEYAHRLFQCLTVASRPFRVEELAQFLVFDLSGGPGSVHRNPREAVLSICSGLVTVVEDSGHRVVHFSHFSFRQFLTSGRLAMARGPVSRFHVSPERAHTIVARYCLGLLLQPDRINGPKVDACPLAKYAAQYWVNHAQFGNVSSSIRNAMESLFDPNNPYFMVWVSTWDIDEWSTSRPLGASPKSAATALYYAALCGFRDVVEWLVTRHLQDVNARGGNYVTPLHATSARGYVNVASFLLEHGADVNLAGNFGQTPLHLAAKNGHFEVAALLLKDGADPNAQDIQDLTPLHCAAHEGQLDVMRVLLLHGGGIAHDKTGATALLREIVGEEEALSTKLGTEAGDLSTEDTIVVRGASAETGRAIKKILEIVEEAKTHSSPSVGFEVDREYVGGIVDSQGSGVNELRKSLGAEVDFSDGGDESKNANKRKGTGLKSSVSFQTNESVKRSIARADSSRHRDSRAPPATLHWKLLPFDAQRSKGKVRFDFAHDVDEILLVQGREGRVRPLTMQERNKSAAEPGLTEMVIHCAELPDWPVHVWRQSGIRCVDVFEAIRDTYKVMLTRTERVTHQSRIRDIERRRQLAAKEGVRRRDLLDGKTLFLGLDWQGFDPRYPYGRWSLKIGSPPNSYSGTSTLQEHSGSTVEHTPDHQLALVTPRVTGTLSGNVSPVQSCISETENQ